jgi:hypothetical protein
VPSPQEWRTSGIDDGLEDATSLCPHAQQAWRFWFLLQRQLQWL